MTKSSLLQGRVEDPPWGRTIMTLAQRKLSAVLEVRADGAPRAFEIAFEGGLVVDAYSPHADDDAPGVAANSKLIRAADLDSIRSAVLSSPYLDEVDVVAQVARLTEAQATRLRRRTLAQRAVRTFSIEHGDFAVRRTRPRDAACAIEIHPIVYLGAIMHMTQERLTRELERIGTSFRIVPDEVRHLARFGFTDVEEPILTSLRTAISAAALVAAHRTHRAKDVLSVVYALACCGACEITQPTSEPERMRSRVNSSVSFKSTKMAKLSPLEVPASPPRRRASTPPARRTPVSTPPVVAPAPPPRPSGTFDLGAALSAELGDTPLPFEQERPPAKRKHERASTQVEVPPPPPAPPVEARVRATTEVDPSPPAFQEPAPPVLPATPITDGSRDARRLERSIKRTEQLLAFVAVPRAPARRK